LSNNSDTAFDVIIVGGGPAGSAAAIACTGQGLRTLLLEANVRFNERPGETLHPGIESLFRSLGIDAAVNRARFLRHAGYVIHSDQGSTFHAYGSDHRGQWLGYQAERAVLHQILLERAEASGAHVRRGERAVRPLMQGSTIIGVATSSANYGSRYVVDAAGPGQWLRRHLRLPCLHVSTLLVAHYGWVSTDEFTGAIEDVAEFSMHDSAWTWIAPVGKGRHAWVSLDLLDRRLKPHLLPSFVLQCPAIGKSGARDVTWRVVSPCAGPGYFMVGDAAWLVDPASSHGVLKSMLSGTVAADAISKALRDPAAAGRIREGYCRWAEDTFCTDAAALISLYSGKTKAPSWLSAASESVRYIASRPSAWAFSTSATKV
jgi:flavin-dependent dehydrogenase